MTVCTIGLLNTNCVFCILQEVGTERKMVHLICSRNHHYVHEHFVTNQGRDGIIDYTLSVDQCWTNIHVNASY